MALVVSQETFDQVVRENVEDLDMDLEEAAEDAIQQFKAQGVDLGNIITDPNMKKESESELSSCIAHLSGFKYNDSNDSDLDRDLQTIRKWCDKGIQYRILAGKFKAYNALINVLSQSLDRGKILTSILKTLTSLLTGYPDLFDDDGADALLSVLSTSKEAEIVVACLKVAQACCLKHEKNRQKFANREIHTLITSLLELSNDSAILIETCELIKLLTLDDDIREQISRAHEHARLIAINNLCILCDLLGKNRNDMATAPHILAALSAIVVRNEFCEKVDQAGGIIHILDILAAHPDTERVNLQCLKMIKVLAGNDDVKLHLMQSGASPLLLAAMSRHKGSSVVSSAGCSCIAALALRSPDNAQVLVDNGAADALVDALKIHSKNGNVQRAACLAIRNLVSRNKGLCATFLSLGVEDLLNSVDKATCWDEAKAALRDLGCNVKLEEPFKGKGVKLSQGD
ncbi:armadillo repeat-containing protein 6 homolog [Thrips palmi]|uniref:Armadillo repeat-containing protein 6 homolog n=1 Tax=Thrips palmi TaxID=161013 RepID=A0A6P8ZQ81_THRPL|nr:armadillo repeat-containing protein 6 homolog [Thrips palmi]XP_034245396.1 armadillo repeat-containing protein 6 homolog [Thrips palmi]